MTKKEDDWAVSVAATARELARANLEMSVRGREAGTQASALDEREEILRLREQTIIARLTAARAVQDRDVVMEQMRAANEALVLATMRADDAAAEAIAARATAAETDTQFQTVVNTVPTLAWFANVEGDVGWYNQRWFDYTGATFEQLRGWGWAIVIAPEDLSRVTEKWRAAIVSGEPWEDTFRIRRHDGVFRWFLSRAVPLRDVAGSIVRWFGTNVDVDEQQRIEAIMRESGRTKDDFLAMLGHELRNPLAPILTALEVIALRDPKAFPREREIISRQVKHLERLVDDLLDISRITRGIIELKRQRVELADIVAGAVEIVAPLLEEKRHRVEIDVARTGLAVDVDVIRMTQVVGNLLTNAAKYTPALGSIVLSAERSGSDVLLRVRDNGIGISAEMITRVFDLFTQEGQALDRARGGLGLGLAIAANIVGLHGGTVTARSEGVDLGSEFTLALPVASEVQEASIPASNRIATPKAARKILLVDDNPDVIELMSEFLRSIGHDVRVACDGPAALSAVQDFVPDVAVLDLGLPVMDGYELAGKLRSLLPRLQLVAVTGYGQHEARTRSRDAGFSHHLVKPVTLESLRKSLLAPDDDSAG